MKQYLDLMRHVRDHGHRKDDRTGTGTVSVFGYQMRFDLAAGFLHGEGVVTSAGDIRRLAYWLYNACAERRKLPEEARAYNELITAWHAIEASSHDAGHRGAQSTMDF